MLAEFLEAFSEKLVDAIRPEAVHVEGFSDAVLISDKDGSIWNDVPPPRRKHTVRSLGDIVLACRDGKIATEPEIYHDSDSIVVLLERSDRRSTITMPLVKSERFKILQNLVSSQGLDVKEAVRLLRFGLHGTGVEAVLAAISKINFLRSSDGSISVEHGRESLGNLVEMAVQQAGSIPEHFEVRTPVYTNGDVRDFVVSVRCGVFIDLEMKKIRIAPLADELDAAMNQVHNQIHAALLEALPTIPIFNGAP